MPQPPKMGHYIISNYIEYHRITCNSVIPRGFDPSPWRMEWSLQLGPSCWFLTEEEAPLGGGLGARLRSLGPWRGGRNPQGVGTSARPGAVMAPSWPTGRNEPSGGIQAGHWPWGFPPLENSERLALKDILNEKRSSINGDQWGMFMNFRGMMSPWLQVPRKLWPGESDAKQTIFGSFGLVQSKNGGRPQFIPFWSGKLENNDAPFKSGSTIFSDKTGLSKLFPFAYPNLTCVWNCKRSVRMVTR